MLLEVLEFHLTKTLVQVVQEQYQQVLELHLLQLLGNAFLTQFQSLAFQVKLLELHLFLN